MALIEEGHEAISYTGWQAGMQTESVHGNARILNIDATRIQAQLQEKKIVVVAGFQGNDANGENHYLRARRIRYDRGCHRCSAECG
ncbi:hypothetical protein RCO48_26530 [Peribacillus frigoritolerans]|nr:hypothetical protein [Peribacillus frigoritolerans]